MIHYDYLDVSKYEISVISHGPNVGTRWHHCSKVQEIGQETQDSQTGCKQVNSWVTKICFFFLEVRETLQSLWNTTDDMMTDS